MLDTGIRRQQRRRNVLHGLVLLATMAGAVAVASVVVFGRDALWWVALAAVAGAIARPRLPPSWVLSMHGAVPLPEPAAPDLHHFLRVLAARAALPRPPRLFYVPTPIANAFAVGGRRDAAVAVTDGLLRNLSGREVAAVLAHELAHVKAGDTNVMALSDALSQLVQALSWAGIVGLAFAVPATARGDPAFLVLALVLMALPTLTTLLQLGLIRSREYDADLEGAALTGDPAAAISALETLERVEGRLWERNLISRRAPDLLLVRTHPPTAERVARLRALLPRPRAGQLGDARRVEPIGYPVAVRRPPRRAPWF